MNAKKRAALQDRIKRERQAVKREAQDVEFCRSIIIEGVGLDRLNNWSEMVDQIKVTPRPKRKRKTVVRPIAAVRPTTKERAKRERKIFEYISNYPGCRLSDIRETYPLMTRYMLESALLEMRARGEIVLKKPKYYPGDAINY
jgi:hypothetical protein